MKSGKTDNFKNRAEKNSNKKKPSMAEPNPGTPWRD
jgi:hypothetical protein